MGLPYEDVVGQWRPFPARRQRQLFPRIWVDEVDLEPGRVAGSAADQILLRLAERLSVLFDPDRVTRSPFVETMTTQLTPGQPDIDTLEGILAQMDAGADRTLPMPSGVPLIEFTLVMEVVGDRQDAYDHFFGLQTGGEFSGYVPTACYRETTVTFPAPDLYPQVPAGLPRHLRDAPHYRRIEHRGGRRRLA